MYTPTNNDYRAQAAALGQSLRRKASNITAGSSVGHSRSTTPTPRVRVPVPDPENPNAVAAAASAAAVGQSGQQQHQPTLGKRVSYANLPTQGYAPVMETINTAVENAGLAPPPNMTQADFTRAVTIATVSALRHQQHAHSPARARVSGGAVVELDDGAGHGGHDAPSWSRGMSASVLLGCTFLYAIIAGRHS
jgi:Ca2+:H+ antiporter